MRSFAQRFPRVSSAFGVARRRHRPIRAVIVLTLHVVGLIMSIDAVMSTRTPQGAIAWAFSLNTVPLIAVPAYAVFGDSGFDEYVATSSSDLDAYRPVAREHLRGVSRAVLEDGEKVGLLATMARISQLPATHGNRFDLLTDGENTFQSIFNEIETAKDYILVQFYIVRDDELGQRLAERLKAKAREGVRVHLLYDDYGSMGLDGKFVRELGNAGVEVTSFMKLDGSPNRFQLNFRNHRKLVVIDGRVAFLGGHNVGVEYLGQHPKLTPWRDSSVRVTGPVVTCLQVPFAEDWMWATGEALKDLQWNLGEEWQRPEGGGGKAVAVATGPAESTEDGSLFFQAAINAAEERIWIATPYLVPDEAVIGALRLAALRGVEVKLLIPDLADSALVRRTSYSYVKELDMEGVTIHRYTRGFLHQKVVLIDENFSAIGSSNLDTRSLRLNFELMLVAEDAQLARRIEAMLVEDFSHSRRVDGGELDEKSKWFQFTVRIARLLAPIQ